jgi:hypothetical protein
MHFFKKLPPFLGVGNGVTRPKYAFIEAGDGIIRL